MKGVEEAGFILGYFSAIGVWSNRQFVLSCVSDVQVRRMMTMSNCQEQFSKR
jgi:hypothetical protein